MRGKKAKIDRRDSEATLELTPEATALVKEVGARLGGHTANQVGVYLVAGLLEAQVNAERRGTQRRETSVQYLLKLLAELVPSTAGAG
jgi:hypothetical protein